MSLYKNKSRKSIDKYDIIRYHRSRLESSFEKMDKEEKLKNLTPVSSDTKLRVQIQNDIEVQINNGKSKLEILAYLNNKYKDTYLSKYFESYIDNKLKNIKTDKDIEI